MNSRDESVRIKQDLNASINIRKIIFSHLSAAKSPIKLRKEVSRKINK